MTIVPKTFGETLRGRRVARAYSLRKFAELAGVSPTYLSRVERGEFDPPTVGRVRRMAELLGEDPDGWILLAGRMPEDLLEILRRHPAEVAGLLRVVAGLSDRQVRKLRDTAKRMCAAPSAPQR